MRSTPIGAATLGYGILLSLSAVNAGQTPQRIPIITTTHFAIYNDFDTNLNDALIAAGLARYDKEPELFHSGAEAPCFDKLPPSMRAGVVERPLKSRFLDLEARVR